MGREGDTPAKNFGTLELRKKWYKLSKFGQNPKEQQFFSGNLPLALKTLASWEKHVTSPYQFREKYKEPNPNLNWKHSRRLQY